MLKSRKRITSLLITLTVVFTNIQLVNALEVNLTKNHIVNTGSSMPNVKSEMNSADYWISKTKDAQKIIMTSSEIALYNKKNADISGTKVYDLTNYKAALSNKELLDFINQLPVPADEDRYIGDVKVDPLTYYNSIKKQMNVQGIKENNNIEYAFTVKRTDIRTLPTKDESLGDANDIEFDYFQESVLESSEPVLVLYKSLDNGWYFIQSNNYRGWVSASDIAIAKDKTKWLEPINSTNFIVITGNRIKLGVNPFSKELSELELGMGTKLNLVPNKDIPETVDGQATSGNYVVQIPTRNIDGSLKFKIALIPAGADISKGYLSYTKANIISQAFKMLGDRYGWGGMFKSRDCSSFVDDIYKSVGIMLPRNTDSQEASAGKSVTFKDLATNKRMDLLKTLNASDILFMVNHEMLYLGSVDGKFYTIQSLYSYGDKNKVNANGSLQKITVNGIVVADLSIPKRGNAKSFIDNLTSSKTIK